MLTHEADGEFDPEADIRNFRRAEWVQIWDADFDTHVLDTSVAVQPDDSPLRPSIPLSALHSGPATARVQAGPSTRPVQTVELDSNENATQANMRSISVTLAPETSAIVNTAEPSEESSASGSTKRKKGKEPVRPAGNKRLRQAPEPMSNADINSRVPVVQLTNYEVPIPR